MILQNAVRKGAVYELLVIELNRLAREAFAFDDDDGSAPNGRVGHTSRTDRFQHRTIKVTFRRVLVTCPHSEVVETGRAFPCCLAEGCQSAESAIDIARDRFIDKELAGELGRLARSGVRVRVYRDSAQYEQESQHGMLMTDILLVAGVQIMVKASPEKRRLCLAGSLFTGSAIEQGAFWRQMPNREVLRMNIAWSCEAGREHTHGIRWRECLSSKGF